MQFTNTFNFEISAPVACFLEVFSHHICYWGSFIGWNEVLQERKDRETGEGTAVKHWKAFTWGPIFPHNSYWQVQN